MRILIVEDEAAAREALRELLELEGHAVTAVATCADASAQLAQQAYDAALLDIHLPDGDGRDLVASVRARCPDAGVYLASASAKLEWTGDLASFEDPAAVAFAAGADGYVSKPVDFDRLLALLERPFTAG